MVPISVVITSYNQRRYLAEAIKSVLRQTVKPNEIIICDDNSTDGSVDLLKEYASKHDNIKLILHDENLGVVKNRNSGLKEAQNPYISILDGDDWYSGNKLELEYDGLNKYDYGWAYSLEKIVTKNGDFKRSRLGHSDGKRGNIFKEIVLKELSPKHWMMTKEALGNVGYLDEDMELYEDWEFKIRLSHDYDAWFSGDSAVYYRQHQSGLHNADIHKHLREKKKVFNKVLVGKRNRFDKLDDFEGKARNFFRKHYEKTTG